MRTIMKLLSLFLAVLFTVLLVQIFLWSRRNAISSRRSDRLCRLADLANDRFPTGFFFGVSTSAYQIEGAWNVSDKSRSVWDYMTHKNPSFIRDRNIADTAADFYHKYKEDIRHAKSIGSNMFKISLSWTRILPNGHSNHISRHGVSFYNDVIDEMLKNGITPLVTIFHWDLPYRFQQLGGFANPLIVNWFEDYAKIVFNLFGDRVRYWITINEPNVFCQHSYGGNRLPAVNQSGIADYLCGHHALLAHARAYHVYNHEFRLRQKGKVGISIGAVWYEPENSTSEIDVMATERVYNFTNNWFLNPIFGTKGDYPKIVKNQVAKNSCYQGFAKSRLPKLAATEREEVNKTADLLGINFYGVSTVRGIKNEHYEVSLLSDVDVISGIDSPDDLLMKDSKDTAWAFGNFLRKLTEEYDVPDIYIIGNGYGDQGDLEDVNRIDYLQNYLSELLKVMQEGIDVYGYLGSSLIDGFEWTLGYTRKFGLFQVDFNDLNRTRLPRLSSLIIADIYNTRIIRSTEEILSP